MKVSLEGAVRPERPERPERPAGAHMANCGLVREKEKRTRGKEGRPVRAE